MRRPGWRKPEGGRRVYLARTRRDGGWIEQLDVEDVRQITRIDWHALDADDAPGIGEAGPAMVHLVCTNGRHDPCCADHGRPVVRALDEAGRPEVWESTHVGGDRFAANVVSLPHGVYYGRVEPDEAAGLLDELRDGLLALHRYRGDKPAASCRPEDLEPGLLAVRTSPYSIVYHRNKKLGVTPLANLQLEPGRYKLTFKNPDRKSVTRNVVIKSGKTTKLDFDLK